MTTRRVRVAVDLLGGDGAPDVVVDGALLATAERADVDVVLVGPSDLAARLITDRDAAALLESGRLDVVPASDVVGMAEDPVRAVRAKRDATVRVAARLVRDAGADAAVSVGSTGAALVAAVFTLGRLPGVTRPALAVAVPAAAGPVVLVDVGANTDCTPDLLAQFALAGVAYAQAAAGVSSPRVGLLSNGTEAGKGDQLRRDAFELLSTLPVDFRGFVESGAITSGADVDVVVTDGFSGNVLLKGIEGMHHLLRDLVAAQVPAQQSVLDVMDGLSPERHGGAVVLGVPGTVVIGHGASDPRAVASCIRLAAHAVRERLVPRVTEAMAQLAAQRREAGLSTAVPK
jgi:phosphate acyltransferase